MLMSIGKELRNLRLSLKITQQEFAHALGITQAALSRIESGRSEIPDAMLIKIATEHKRPEMLAKRCKSCAVLSATRKFYFPEMENSGKLLVHQLKESMDNIVSAMLATAESWPAEGTPEHYFALMAISHDAVKLQNIINGFRIALGRPPVG